MVTYEGKTNGDYPLYIYNLKKGEKGAAESGRLALTTKGDI